MEAENIVEIERVIFSCNKMLTGRFLDLSKALNQFMDLLTQSDDVTKYLADCLEDFDEKTEFENAFSYDRKSATVKVEFPEEDNKKMALFVTVFNNILNETTNANQFLETYFQDRKGNSIQNFLDKVIRPFRDTLCKVFSMPTEVSEADIKKHEKEQSNKIAEEQAEKIVEAENPPEFYQLTEDISFVCNEMLATLKFEKKRTDNLDDLEFIVGAISQACEQDNLSILNGLVIGLNYASKKFKSIKYLVAKLNKLIYDYYETIANMGEFADEHLTSADEIDTEEVVDEAEDIEEEKDEEDAE